MAQYATYVRIATFVVAGVLFLVPFYELANGVPATSLGFLPDHVVLSAIFALGLGARSWREAILLGIVFGMLANAVYAAFGFGWFHSVYGEAANSSDDGWGAAAIDILVWTPFIGALVASIGYLVRWVVLRILGPVFAG